MMLPEIEDSGLRHRRSAPLGGLESWVNTTCPICGGPAHARDRLLDTFLDSSWYFLRYADPKNADAAWSKEKLAQWSRWICTSVGQSMRRCT